ncbi:MAG: exo-alpha-sialidase, partial [Clostridia bacterium]|nr:exo-alpha-sialidase [Clostridia bacterium]
IRTEPNFTLFQSESTDGGKTFSEPVRLLPDAGGAPSHLMLHSSGKLIATYGYRQKPYGIRVMVSDDLGKTWKEKALSLYETDNSPDLGYPCSVELSDGSILTVFYSRSGISGWEIGTPCEIYQTVWKLEE